MAATSTRTDAPLRLEAAFPAEADRPPAAPPPRGGFGTARTQRSRGLALPAALGLAALAVFVYGGFGRLSTPLVLLAAATVLGVIARAASTFRTQARQLAATRIEAQTDALTGIGNRRKLVGDLSATLEARVPALLVLLDLDGFKGYNDSFGHPAGDALLARLAARLAAAVAGDGEVYRIGGDEFCVLGHVEREEHAAFASRAAHALEDHGEGFCITAAQGSVLLPHEAGRVAEALRLADTRMYAAKDSRRVSSGRQDRGVLLRALYEREARLEGRLGDLVKLVRSVGRTLGLSGDEVGDLALAAELHEVGMMAIPDSILHKHEPLTDEESRFLRRHPLIGERILSSAPALAEVSRVVRSVNEHVDGSGYPDGLAGEDVPLGSRVISACAAFLELTRPGDGRPMVTPQRALVELRAAAGTRFDPLVLEALAVEYGGLYGDPPLARSG